MLASEPVMLRVGRQISSRSNLFWIYNADRITTEKQSWNALIAWSVIITIAQWLDIFSSKISRHLNSKKKKKKEKEKITAIFSHSSKNISNHKMILFFFFLPVSLPAKAFVPLAGLLNDEVINFRTSSKSLCLWKSPGQEWAIILT